MAKSITPSGAEVFFDKQDIIVSKTDIKGRITYTNKTFMDISGFKETELIGSPHSMIRHPKMPRSIFKLLWDRIEAKQEVFAYVVNLCKNGDHYWVLAHVTPSFDANDNINGYHSNRRVPNPSVIQNLIQPLYKKLLECEKSEKNRKAAMNKSSQLFQEFLKKEGLNYDEFIFSIKG